MKTRNENADVLYPDEPVIAVGQADLEELKRLALASPKKRARLCTHAHANATLHEMFIVIAGDSYVRPHKHLGRSESFCVLEGSVMLIRFDDSGIIESKISLTTSGRGAFYHRMDEPVFHTVVVTSPLLVVHEITLGPFQRDNTVFAPWAPAETELTAHVYHASLVQEARR